MRKHSFIIASLMIICMIFTFAGCGSSDTGESSDSGSAGSSEQPEGSGSYFD